MTVREEDVHDRDPARQGHVSAYLLTYSRFRSNIPLHLITSHFLMTLSSFYFEL